MLTFRLVRHKDPTGVSGTGVVAHGVQFPSGRVVLEWRPPVDSITLHRNMEDVHKIHCHGGDTTVEWGS